MVFSKKDSGFFDSSEKPWSIKSLVSRIKKKRNSDLDDFMVIGIDFGTTYSGVAWATIADFEKDQINLITSWPGCGREEGKAPTELFYEHDQTMWGYDIPADAEPIRWFKLLLLREEDLDPELRQAEYLLRAQKVLREHGKTATDLIADYLKCLWQHILHTIHKARGKSVVEGLTFHVVITVPAIWKGYARQGMEEAAKKAGILNPRPAGRTTLAFAPEPEAAALATICEPGRTINEGDVYVICDAGGGTVDLVSYKVGDTDPITLHEAVVGTGGLCGGIFIDEAFEGICKARLGRQWSKLSQTGIKEIMKNEWEYAIKPQYRADDTTKKEYIVAIPAEAFKGASMNDDSRKPIIKEGRIYFSSSDIQKAFTSVFTDIEKLVDEQINKAKASKLSVTGIILVGGLGSSPYLYDHLVARYERRKKLRVLQSTGIRPRTAICRGAIFKGFLDGPTQSTSDAASGEKYTPKVTSSVSVASTIARQSLGLVMATTFEDGKHLNEDRYWDDDEGRFFANNQMQWYLEKGQNVPKLQPVQHSFYQLFSSEDAYYEASSEFKAKVKQCDDDTPPSRNTSKVKDLCTITVKLDVPYEALEDFYGAQGKMLKKLDYTVEMVPSGASIDFAVLYDGIKLGSQNARVEFE
ncbi:actin-like ATPase domain-containing protein [Hypomontagnella submonticulosa]|nr:actin-like ATPase domain-containing protein [Hypomontagnella submonticulosa]